MSASRKGRPPVQRAKRAMSDAAHDLAPVFTALLLAIPVVLAGLFFVWTRLVTVRLGYEISQASEAHHRLLEENRGLRIESAALRAPARLEQLAREGHKLAPARPEQIIRLDPGTALAEPSLGASAPIAVGSDDP